jgi:DNA-binding FrmR family transcriptional regulator
MAGTTEKTRRKAVKTPGAGPRASDDVRAHAPDGPAPLAAACGCGCGVQEADGPLDGRKAHGVDPDIKARNLTRLRRAEGQVRGLQKMVEEDRYCADILTQISSVHEALRAVGRELMRNHLKHCATAAITRGPDAAEGMYDELVEMMYKHSR